MEDIHNMIGILTPDLGHVGFGMLVTPSPSLGNRSLMTRVYSCKTIQLTLQILKLADLFPHFLDFGVYFAST